MGAEPPASSLVEHEGSALPIIWQVEIMGYQSIMMLGSNLGYIVFTIERDRQNNFTN